MTDRRDIVDQIALPAIDRVVFFQRDELTTDLICCDVVMQGIVHSFHEDMKDWDRLMRHLSQLPGFRADWYESVTVEAFAPNQVIAYQR